MGEGGAEGGKRGDGMGEGGGRGRHRRRGKCGRQEWRGRGREMRETLWERETERAGRGGEEQEEEKEDGEMLHSSGSSG